MKLAVIGTGYVGLVTGAGFADFGNDVTCVDVDGERIATLERGEIPFYEPGLAELVARNRAQGRLGFTTSTAAAVARSQIVFIAVGTPSDASGNADLGFVLEAARQIGRAIDGFTVIVTKSTVPVGTADQIRDAVAAETTQPFAVASNPEFLKEGDAVNDFLRPSRVVVGADDPAALDVLRKLYTGFLRTSDRIQTMSVRSAELTKYAANAMLATRISFMNELALLAEKVGADIDRVRVAIGADPRIGPKFLFPGTGWGGSCFPKDLRALAHAGRANDQVQGVVEAVIAANERQKRIIGERLIALYGGSLARKRVALWGLAFKPETDDIRESPALVMIDQIRAAGGEVRGYDPAAMPNIAKASLPITLVEEPYAAAEGADAVVLVTEWHQLRHPDFTRLRTVMREPVLFDGRNVWNPDEARAAGFRYVGIGRP
jgi:UDPglucose 6-dehydrogenase